MAEIIEKIQLKRGTKANLEAVLVGDKKPAAGEPIYELDTNKLKIGDGTHSYAELEYIGGSIDASILFGYYLNNKFYTDSTYTVELPKDNTKLYINLNQEGNAYTWNGTDYIPTAKNATEEVAGILKLYKNNGINEDGTMTQKAITKGIDDIEFSIETVEDEDGDGEDECVLVLNKPW